MNKKWMKPFPFCYKPLTNERQTGKKRWRALLNHLLDVVQNALHLQENPHHLDLHVEKQLV